MLLFITTQNCLYCRKMEHDTFASQKVVWGIQRSCVPVAVAAEKNEALVKKLRVNLYPTTVIISPTSGVVDYIVGYVGPDEFSRRLAAATERSTAAAASSRVRHALNRTMDPSRNADRVCPRPCQCALATTNSPL